jgi:IMP dehydrogenase
MSIIEGLSFDDVLLLPKYSEVATRSKVDTSVNLPKGFSLKVPLVSANMSHVTGPYLAAEIVCLGGMGILHRFTEDQELLGNYKFAVELVSDTCMEQNIKNIGCSVGVKHSDYNRAEMFIRNGCKIICVDVAHGHHLLVGEFLKNITPNHPEVLWIAGNVCTAEGAQYLYECGADVVKCGIGSGSTCSTRIETGNGCPQITTLDNICNATYLALYENKEGPVFISDGGIRNASDVCKALTFTDLVMIGNMFAGTDESPGGVISVDGKQYKQYAGSSTHKKEHVEGVSGLVPYRGSLENVVSKIMQGVRSCCSYQGVDNLEDLKRNPQFVRISNSGLIESHPHDIKM